MLNHYSTEKKPLNLDIFEITRLMDNTPQNFVAHKVFVVWIYFEFVFVMCMIIFEFSRRKTVWICHFICGIFHVCIGAIGSIWHNYDFRSRYCPQYHDLRTPKHCKSCLHCIHYDSIMLPQVLNWPTVHVKRCFLVHVGSFYPLRVKFSHKLWEMYFYGIWTVFRMVELLGLPSFFCNYTANYTPVE